MKQILRAVVLFSPFFSGVLLSAAVGSQTAPTAPQRGTQGSQPSSALSRMTPAVRAEVERLVADDSGKRATAAASLGEMGAQAVDAFPWLVAVATDSRSVISLTRGNTTVAAVAVEALTKIDPKWRQSLLRLASDPKAPLARQAITALGVLRDRESVEQLLMLYRTTAEPLPEVPTRDQYFLVDAFRDTLGCFPEPQVAEAYLDVAAMRVRRPDDKFNSALWAFARIVGKYEGDPEMKTAETARAWWSARKATVRLVELQTCPR